MAGQNAQPQLAAAAPLHHSADQGLLPEGPAAAATFLMWRAQIRLVGLDAAAQQACGIGPERGAHLVQQRPGRAVAPKAAVALQLERGDPLLVAADEEDGQKPGA